ncbi:MAG: UbiD family decarboxylase, partial [Methanobrevibacter sp.]|nr:UbiD family decarboxylase [Methanobrevibacter sp.]
MENFLKLIKDEYGIIKIEEEVSSEYEAARILREHPEKTVLLENIAGYDIPIISGICNTREKIAKSLGCTVDEITQKVIKATENPQKVTNYLDINSSNYKYKTANADLSKIPILTH